MHPSRFRYRQSKPTTLSVEEQSQLSNYLNHTKGRSCVMHIRIGKAKPLRIPTRLQQQVIDVLTVASRGAHVAVTPLTSTLTTQEAAERLGVSRPHIVSLIERKLIPATKVGAHRRILRSDFDNYLKRQTKIRSKALSSLMQETQKLSVGY